METYNGHVRTPADAILLFEACRIGLLPRVQRRLSEKERQQIKSGSVFVWDEREAGMRRWTDGKSWSASRVSGSFLTYREMEGKRGGSFPAPAPAPKRPTGRSPEGSATGNSDSEGPEGYRYKQDGLMKQSFSITTSSGQHLHLISYFSRSHSTNLTQPTSDPQLRHIRPPKNMYPESSVNENQTVPAVTRGPMTGSPYAPAPQQMGSQSPYSRPGPSPQMPVLYAPYPGPPTPPYQHTYFIHPSHALAYQQAGVYYAPHGYHHPPGLTHLDRLPPHMNPSYPPPGHAYPGHPHPHQLPPQYVPHLPQRAMQVTDAAMQQSQAGGHHAQHQPQHQQHQHQHHQAPHINTTLPEQGPQLPALNGIGKPSTPQPSEPKSSESLNVPSTNGTSQTSAPSPSRTIPNIHTLLNNHAEENNSEPKAGQPNSRAGSHSPGNTQRPPREMVASANSAAADTSAISRLNSTFHVIR